MEKKDQKDKNMLVMLVLFYDCFFPGEKEE